MPLNDQYPLAVTFIIGPVKQKDDSYALEPIGTGFIVRLETRDRSLFEYVVTALHVVEGARESYVRIRMHDGGFEDLPVDKWVPHERGADVAVTSLARTDAMNVLWVPAPGLSWPLSPRLRPDLGDRVYFLGLLALPGARGLFERNVPMVRSGTIGAMYQDDIPLAWPDKTTRKTQAHLIDCRSYGGFSGSPCFFQRDDQWTGVKEGKETRGTTTFLLGLISAHFDDFTSAKTLGPVRAPINTGVGIVTPVERIVEVIDMPEFKDERERVQNEREQRPEEGATLDTAGESEYERFEQLARELVNTPKPKPDESES